MIDIKAEDLAYWYFRLNGCLTIQNFIVHPDQGRNQRTDVDFIAVRFPHRAELEINPMDDHPPIASFSKTRIFLAEVKAGRCVLNGPWTDRTKGNMQLVLRAVGTFPLVDIEKISQSLYDDGVFEDNSYVFGLCCVGNERSDDVTKAFPLVPQITWDEIAGFIYRRFSEYQQKIDHPQWNSDGKALWELAKRVPNADDFRRGLRFV